MTTSTHHGLFAGHAWYVPGVRGMFGLFGWLLLGVLLSIIVEDVLGLFLSEQTIQVYGDIVTYPLGFLPAIIYATKRSQKNKPFHTGYAPDSRHFEPYGLGKAILLTVVMTFAAMMVLDLISYWNTQWTNRSSVMAHFYETLMGYIRQMTGGPFLPAFLTVAILPPIFEEWMCRGMVLRGLLTRMKPFWAILLSALFFSVMHLNPWQGVEALLIGLVMGYIYYKTGSLLLTMLIHFVNNATSVIASHLDCLKDYEDLFWVEIMDKQVFAIVYIVSCVILIACLWAFSCIRVENPWGNMDRFPPTGEMAEPTPTTVPDEERS